MVSEYPFGAGFSTGLTDICTGEVNCLMTVFFVDFLSGDIGGFSGVTCLKGASVHCVFSATLCISFSGDCVCGVLLGMSAVFCGRVYVFFAERFSYDCSLELYKRIVPIIDCTIPSIIMVIEK